MDTPSPNAPENTEPRLMSAQRAATLVADVLKWKLEIPTLEPSVRSVPTDKDRVHGGSDRGLPFGLNAVIDTADTDGAQGVTTEAGVDLLLELWASWLSWILNAGMSGSPGAWLLKQLQENQDLLFIDDWEDWAKREWAQFTTELKTLWHRVGAVTGNSPQTRTVCPNCKTGVIQQHWTNKGLSRDGQCSNPHCRLSIDYAEENTRAAYRAALRDPALTDTWVTLSEVQAIWPNINDSTLRTWVDRGHVEKRDGYYNLGMINQRRLTQHNPKPNTL